MELGGALVCSDEDSLWEQRVDEVLRDLYVLLQKVDFLLQFVSNFVRERERVGRGRWVRGEGGGRGRRRFCKNRRSERG